MPQELGKKAISSPFLQFGIVLKSLVIHISPLFIFPVLLNPPPHDANIKEAPKTAIAAPFLFKRVLFIPKPPSIFLIIHKKIKNLTVDISCYNISMLVMVVWLLSLVVLVLGILGIMSKIFGSHKSTALKALNDKYLKGEITKEEYEQTKRVLENL